MSYENRMTHGVCHTTFVWHTQSEDEVQDEAEDDDDEDEDADD